MKMNEKTKKAIKGSIAHWKRMIRWVKKQKSYERAILSEMKEGLGENWGVSDCSLCDLFSRVEGYCKKCPLAKKYGYCTVGTENAWALVNNSYTWEEWLYNADRMLQQLKSLEE